MHGAAIDGYKKNARVKWLYSQYNWIFEAARGVHLRVWINKLTINYP